MELNDDFSNKYYDSNDESGLNQVIKQRQQKLSSLRERLQKYYLEDDEIDKLFKIIIDAEIKMEKIKASTDFKKATSKDLLAFQKRLIDIQNKMKEEFDSKLNKTLKTKFEKAKKYLDKKKKFH